MPQVDSIKRSVFQIDSSDAFNVAALQIFQYQYKNNAVYHEFVNQLHINSKFVSDITKIPFLPIEFFKTHRVTGGNMEEEAVFSSSGTTGSQTSKHYVQDLALYEKSFLKGFEYFFGPADDYVI